MCHYFQIDFFSLFQAGRNCRDLFEDLRDGHNLLSLLEVLSGEILVCFITCPQVLVFQAFEYTLEAA
jgi:hypothetical protein